MTKPNGKPADETNVVAILRPSDPLPLECCELRLLEAECGLLMTVADERKLEYQLEFKLISSPSGFSLDLLRRAWRKWRNSQIIGDGRVASDEG